MEIIAASETSAFLAKTLYILYVAIGIGLVILFHEFGHFAVARWCGVLVERFSIGFGPILWSKKKGDTEYALSAIPFGGYVKMLGQDDLDASQLSSEEIAEDPRSYSAKPVWQRMAIISAGVIMNVMTGLLFFAFAFHGGVETDPPLLGYVEVGMPAWKAGLRTGDEITSINGRPVNSFSDILRGVLLTAESITIKGVHRDGQTFEEEVIPDASGTRRMIGVGPTLSLKVTRSKDPSLPLAVPGTPAADASPAFAAEDVIERIDDVPISSFAELQEVLAQRAGETVHFYVQPKRDDDPRKRTGGLVKITVGPRRFRTLGLLMDIEKIVAIQKDSPAEQGGLKEGDKIINVDDQEVGKVLNPLWLPGYFASRHGKSVSVVVKREEGETKLHTLYVTPINRPGWIEKPSGKNVPLSVPSIGIGFHVTTTVLKVQEASPAAEKKIRPGARVTKMELIRPDDAPKGIFDQAVIPFEFSEKEKNWAAAFWAMQEAPLHKVRLTVSQDNQTFELTPRPDPTHEWFIPTRGIALTRKTIPLKSDNPVKAMHLGLIHTGNTMTDIYLTLRNLFAGRLSYKELHGPISIATIAYQFAEHGIAELSLFLGLLSINLAVLNFLPIPVLDGGHMVFLCWEAVTRKKPTERVLAAATYSGLLFVLGLMLVVIFLDIQRMIS